MKRCRSNPTNINDLPGELVTKILKRVPIQNAVRTSILSREWRYAWTKLRKLVFDDGFCVESVRNTKSKLIKAITQVLFVHGGPLKDFKLLVSNLENCFEIDQFILVVLKAGVKYFELTMPKGSSYRLPSTIFAYNQQLESLDIRYCVFKPPSGLNGFGILTYLFLADVGITGSELSILISNCPLLKILRFESSTNCGCLDIATPNLEEFFFDGLCESICFKNTPKLTDVKMFDLDAQEEIEASSQVLLSGRLPNVEQLGVGQFYLEAITANREPGSLLSDVCHLKSLFLGMCFGIPEEVFSTCCIIINNSNNLEDLRLCIYNDVDVDNDVQIEALKGVERLSDVTFGHLKILKLKDANGSKCEMRFIELMLAKSPVLEKLVIDELDTEVAGDNGLRFYKELSTFRRRSLLVEISYMN